MEPPIKGEVKVNLTKPTKLIVEKTTKFLETVFGPGSTALGELIRDRINFWRSMNMLNLADKLNVEIKKRGLDQKTLRRLPFGEAVPLIEAASFEDSEEVQHLWSGLLASALDPDSPTSVEKVFVALLKELGPAEASLLRLLWKYRWLHQSVTTIGDHQIDEIFEELETSWRKFDQATRDSAIGNLRRLGCIQPHVTPPDVRGLITQARGVRMGGLAPTSINPAAMDRFIRWVVEQIGTNGGQMSSAVDKNAGFRTSKGIKPLPEISLRLTPLGERLMAAVEP